MSLRMDRVDARLVPFLSASTDSEADRVLGDLLEELQPVVQAIVRRKVGHDSSAAEIEDVCSDVIVKVLDRLEHLRGAPDTAQIADLRSYVAVVAYNACHALIRSKHPRRWQLKNRIRYVISRQPGFAQWQGDRGEILCAANRWRDGPVVESGPLEEIVTATSRSLSRDPGEATISDLRDLLHAILEEAKGPVEMDALVARLADAYRIDETTSSAESLETLPDARADFASAAEKRSYLRRLWNEIRELPVRQRIALLLNLRDLDEGVIALLPLAGIASIRQIAGVLEIQATEFARLWKDLPIDDATIAGRLGITGQQVINLRKSARARLARRMRGK